MMIFYNGITFTCMELKGFSRTAVYDTTGQTDHVMDEVYVHCTAMVNGLEAARLLSEPPISYKEVSGSPTSDRNTESDRSRPPSLPPSSGPPPTTVTADRNRGAFRNSAFEKIAAYKASVNPPAFAQDNKKVVALEPVANAPILTEKLIHTRLLDPRGQLIVFTGTGEDPQEVLLHSPGWGRHCDAKNGPLPQQLRILQSFGEAGSFFIEWACVTYVNDQPRTNREDPLLSNRFSMSHTLDEDYFTTISVQGEALFDVGLLHSRGINPDKYRPNLFLPIPQGFVRENIQVTGLPGMEGVSYSFSDRQLPMSFAAGPYAEATRIHAEHAQVIDCTGDPSGSFLAGLSDYYNRRWLRNNSQDSTPSGGGRKKRRKAKPPGP